MESDIPIQYKKAPIRHGDKLQVNILEKGASIDEQMKGKILTRILAIHEKKTNLVVDQGQYA